MGLGGFCCNRNICPVTRGTFGNGQSNTTAGAAYKKCFALQAHGGLSLF
jgi:hypothetical protein